MPLSSLLKRKEPTPDKRPAAADESAAVQAARTQARRRLIGAVVLLAIGIVGFPLIFETQPRPIALDVPIEIARKPDLPVAPPVQPAPRPEPASAAPPPKSRPLPELPPETKEDTGTEVAAAPPPAAASAPRVPASTPPAPDATPPAARPAAAPPRADEPAAARSDDGARAQALLEGTPASEAKAPRYVVQVGAYTDAAALRDARTKVEKLGLKTYTQVVETEAGKRTRVRVGPYATRAEADSAGAKLKDAGLPVAVLAL